MIIIWISGRNKIKGRIAGCVLFAYKTAAADAAAVMRLGGRFRSGSRSFRGWRSLDDGDNDFITLLVGGHFVKVPGNQLAGGFAVLVLVSIDPVALVGCLNHLSVPVSFGVRAK